MPMPARLLRVGLNRAAAGVASSRPGRTRLCFEPLEDRRLLAGLTLVTHGFQIFGDRPAWLDSWQDAIAKRVDPNGTDASRYEVFIGEDNSNISKYDPATPALAETASGEVIVTLDWAERSNDFFLFGDGSDSTADLIAQEVVPFLTNAYPGLGITAPLLQLPIHLIGHSRGASVVTELARELGERGAWVEHLSLLDPHPLVAGQDDFVNGDEEDPPIVLYENLLFADNIWRADGDSLDFNGEFVEGALNLELDDSILDNGGYSLGHSDTHLFYYGTIDLALDAQEDGTSVPNGWYAAHGVDRAEYGFYFSRLGGGFETISADHLATGFGGNAAREPLTRSGSQWPNVMLDVAVGPVYAGETFDLTLSYQDVDTGATISAWLDTDRNPFNGDTGVLVHTESLAATGNSIVSESTSWTLPDGADGVYYLKTLIEDGSQQRFAYAPRRLSIVPDQDQPPSHPSLPNSNADSILIPVLPTLPALGPSESDLRENAWWAGLQDLDDEAMPVKVLGELQVRFEHTLSTASIQNFSRTRLG